MTAEQLDQVSLATVHGHVEVTGLSQAEVAHALHLWDAVRQEVDRERQVLGDHVNLAVLRTEQEILPAATQRQIRREAALRARLVDQEGALTYAALAALRHSGEPAARTWVSRRRKQGEMFTVELKGQTLIPTVQLTDSGEVDPLIAEMTRPLTADGADGWAIWAWLTSPTGLLSGQVPHEVARTAGGHRRAVRAASRHAQQLAGRVE